MVSQAHVQGSILSREFPRCCFFLFLGLFLWDAMKRCLTHLDQEFTQHLSVKILKRTEGLWSYSEMRFLRSQSETFTAVNLVTYGTG